MRNSRQRILDAAERLFARDGLGRTSLRAIIAEAGVNTAAVHYHFGARAELLRAVFEQIIAPLQQERVALLEAAQGRAARPSLRAVLHAQFWPVFSMLDTRDDPASIRRLSIIGQLRLDPSPEARAILREHDQRMGALFEAPLARALPGVGRALIDVRSRLATAAAWDAVGQPDVLAWLGGGSAHVSVRRLFQHFLDFVCAGFLSRSSARGHAPRRFSAVRASRPARSTQRREVGS